MLALNQLEQLLHLLVRAERGPVHFISFPIPRCPVLADHPYKKFCGGIIMEAILSDGVHSYFNVIHNTVCLSNNSGIYGSQVHTLSRKNLKGPCYFFRVVINTLMYNYEYFMGK